MLKDKNLEKDLNSFNDELKKLLGKYDFVLTATPIITQDGRVLAQPTLARAQKEEEKDTLTKE